MYTKQCIAKGCLSQLLGMMAQVSMLPRTCRSLCPYSQP